MGKGSGRVDEEGGREGGGGGSGRREREEGEGGGWKKRRGKGRRVDEEGGTMHDRNSDTKTALLLEKKLEMVAPFHGLMCVLLIG